MTESDQEKASWWEKWGWLYWPAALVGLGVAIGGNFWAISLPGQVAGASAAAVVGVTLGILVLPAMLMYAGLTAWSRRISENRSKLKNVINAGRLASLLVPILCVALALSLPVTWPVFLAAAALPLAAMLMAGAYHGLRYLAEKMTPSGASVKNNSEDAHTPDYRNGDNKVKGVADYIMDAVTTVAEDGPKDHSILLKQAIDACNVDQVRGILARFVDKQAPMIKGRAAPAYAIITYKGKHSREQNDILKMLSKHHQSAMMTPQDRLYNALMAGELSEANALILSGAQLGKLTQEEKNRAILHLIKTYKNGVVPNENYLEVVNDHHRHFVGLLMANGADPNAQDVDGNAALHLAILNDHIDLAENIINRFGKKLQIDLENNRGETPLSLVVSQAPYLLAILFRNSGDNAADQLQMKVSQEDRIMAWRSLLAYDQNNSSVRESIKLLEASGLSMGEQAVLPTPKAASPYDPQTSGLPFGISRLRKSDDDHAPGNNSGV